MCLAFTQVTRARFGMRHPHCIRIDGSSEFADVADGGNGDSDDDLKAGAGSAGTFSWALADSMNFL